MEVRGAIKLLLSKGTKPGAIARTLGVKPWLVYKWKSRFELGGDIKDLPRSGRPPKAVGRIKVSILNRTKGKQRASNRKVATAVSDFYGVPISRETVRTLVHAARLRPRRRTPKPLMRRGMKYKRRKFCKKYRNYNWNHVLFVDEASFWCFELPNRKHDIIWLPIGHKREPTPKVAHGDKLHVFGGFSASGVRIFHIFTGKYTAAVYIDILQQVVKPIIDDHKEEVVYVCDNSPIHTAKKAQAWLTDNIPSHIPRTDWPPNSPDLNPIENAWARLKDHVATQEPMNFEELKKAVKKAWIAVMTKEYCQELADSMPRRLTRVHAANGAPIKY